MKNLIIILCVLLFYNEGFSQENLENIDKINTNALTSNLTCYDIVNILGETSFSTLERQASNRITTSMNIKSGATALFHAGNEVLLLNGFTAENGSDFKGYIEGCSSILATASFEMAERITIAPNPNNGVFSIAINDLTDTQVEIIDLYGRTIQKNDFDNQSQLEVNIEDKPLGIYLVKITSNEGSFTSKIIKN